MITDIKNTKTVSRPQSVSHWRMVIDKGLVTPEVAEWNYSGSGTEDDPYLVDWIPNDPRNPMTWPASKKWSITMLVALLTLAIAYTSSTYSGGAAEVKAEFDTSDELVTLGVSLFVLGFALGPLLWGPMSELWGRQILFFLTSDSLPCTWHVTD